MRRGIVRSLFVAAVLVLACLACRPPSTGAGSRLAGSFAVPSFPLAQAGVPGTVAPGAPARRFGTLTLVVRWPQQDRPGFRAALLPTTTKTIAVWVRSGDRDLLESPKTVTRAGDAATTSVSIPLPEAVNLSVEVTAYREASPDFATAAPIAIGFAVGINIVPDQTTSASLVLDAVSVSAIASLDSSAGAEGSQVAIRGLNFTVAAGATLSVAFNGTVSPAVTVVDDSNLTATVPTGAKSGSITVTNDGVQSTSYVQFYVAKAFEVRGREPWDPSPGNKRLVLLGQSLPIFGVPTSIAYEWGDAASPSYGVATMSVQGVLDGSVAGTAPAPNVFQAGESVATASLTARAGTLTSTNALEISVEDASVSLTPVTAALGPYGSPYAALEALTLLTSGFVASESVPFQTDCPGCDSASDNVRTVAFVSSSPATVSTEVASTGVTVAVPGTGYGYVTLSAQSLLLPGRQATASVVVTAEGGKVSTLAGGNGGFSYPRAVALVASGDVYVADTDNHRIRKVAPDGGVTTIVGGNGEFYFPYGVAVDASGSIYVADTYNHRIRKVTPDGAVTTLASGFDSPHGVAVDSAGNVYVADTYNHLITKVTSGGSVSTLAGGNGEFNYPRGVAVDAAGNVYVADTDNHRIRKATPGGSISTIAGGNGEVYYPSGVAVDAAGNVFVADTHNHRIRKVMPGGSVSTLAGGNGEFSYPRGVAVDAAGNVYVADTNNHRVRKAKTLPGEVPQVGKFKGKLTLEVE